MFPLGNLHRARMRSGAMFSRILMPEHKVKKGECLSSIAAGAGFDWNTIWLHPRNESLRRDRVDPNVLFAGDNVFIPDKSSRKVSAATDQKHTYVKKSVPAKLRLQLLDEEREPLRHVEYELDLGGILHRRRADGDGRIEHDIPPNLAEARLRVLDVDGDGREELYQLALGNLDPVAETIGVQQRLTNLGFVCGVEDGELGERTADALKLFQQEVGLPESGELDDATKQELVERHGS